MSPEPPPLNTAITGCICVRTWIVKAKKCVRFYMFFPFQRRRYREMSTVTSTNWGRGGIGCVYRRASESHYEPGGQRIVSVEPNVGRTGREKDIVFRENDIRYYKKVVVELIRLALGDSTMRGLTFVELNRYQYNMESIFKKISSREI